MFGFSFYTAHYIGAWVFIAGVRRARRAQAAAHGGPVCGRGRCGPSCAPPCRHPRRSPTTTDWSPSRPATADDEPARRARAGRRRGAVRRGDHRGPDDRRLRRWPRLLPPRGLSRGDGGPNDFPVNKTVAVGRHRRPVPSASSWRLDADRRAADRSCSTAPMLTAQPQHTARCRSPASRAGRPPRPGPGCGCATSPRWPGVPEPKSRSCGRWSARRVQRRRRCTAGQVRAPRRAARAAGQRRRPVAGPRLPGADHRSRAARRAQHQVGRLDRVQVQVIWQRTSFRRIYGSHPLHLLTLVAGFALVGYVVATIKPAALWNPHTWWQSIIVWFAAAIIAHDLVLFPVYALADRLLLATGAARRPPRRCRSSTTSGFLLSGPG